MPKSRPAPGGAGSYDSKTIALHWITVLLVAALWTIGQTIDFWPRGALRVDYRSLHVVLGVLLAGVIVVRLHWRITRGTRLPVEGPLLLAIAARTVHWALYALVCATVVLGILTAFAQNTSLFGLFSLPSPRDRALAHLLHGWHALGANAVLILAGLHAAAALMHHTLLRDDTLRRMLPRALRG